MTPQPQFHFFDKFQRTVQLAGDRDEPEVWFKELRILDDLTLSPGTERRRIVLHRGFNILWAAPEDPDTEQGLYREGLAGHASGKTMFCRILRHFLGEQPFGTKAQRDGIQKNFLGLWAVALVRVSRVSWVVGRPLATDGVEFAVPAESIDAVLSGIPPSGGFPEFLAQVKAVGKPLDSLHPDQGWRHLLPWLSRDQEARFGNLAAWRETSSEGDSPQTKAVERHQLMRAVLGLLDLREPTLRSSIERDTTALDAGVAHLGRLESELAGQISLARARASETIGESAPVEIGELQQRLQSLADVLREGVAELEKRPEPPAVTQAASRLQTAYQNLHDVQQELARLPVLIAELKDRQGTDLSLIRNLKSGNVEDPAREAAGFCPKSIQFARQRHCVEAGVISTESATNIAELEQRAADLAQRITGFEARATELRGQLDPLRAEHAAAQRAHASAQLEASREAIALTRRAERAQEASRTLAGTAATKKSIEVQAAENKRLVDEIELRKQEIAALRDDADTRLRVFSDIFADIVRAVMGASVEAKISITADGIVPHVTRKGELSGAALDTIKTLAFDLAAVVASIEGRGSHPRFLIHDGPREGDMARVIYERFFLYAAGLETAYSSPDNAGFQYIITTTTPPPKTMQRGSRWLLEPVLDSRQKENRLLNENF